ncbi:MAG: hypothetical protein ABIV94_08890, partial [Acidimicrobiales bacterium]
QSWADDGSKSPSARLGRECRLSPRVAGAEVRRARKLRHMPHTSAALAAGDLSVDHITALAACNRGRLLGLFARDEELLVGEARRLCFTDFVQVLALWRQNADDAADADRAAHQHEDRFFEAARTFQGTVDLRGLLDPITGEIVLNELHRLEQRLFEADWAEARARLGTKAIAADLIRTPSQRRADALVEMAQRSAAMAPGARAARPLITILWGAASFRDALCETDRGVTLNPHQVLPLLTDADIERIVFAADSRILDVGTRERFFTGALRRAIEVRDRHCAHPSDCHVPAPTPPTATSTTSPTTPLVGSPPRTTDSSSAPSTTAANTAEAHPPAPGRRRGRSLPRHEWSRTRARSRAMAERSSGVVMRPPGAQTGIVLARASVVRRRHRRSEHEGS